MLGSHSSLFLMITSERKAKERERRKALGLVRVEVWVKPEHRQKIRQLSAELNKAH